MTKKSVEKLLAAGYVFLRVRTVEGKAGRVKHAIYRSECFGVWKLMANYETRAACERALMELDGVGMFIVD